MVSMIFYFFKKHPKRVWVACVHSILCSSLTYFTFSLFNHDIKDLGRAPRLWIRPTD